MNALEVLDIVALYQKGIYTHSQASLLLVIKGLSPVEIQRLLSGENNASPRQENSQDSDSTDS